MLVDLSRLLVALMPAHAVEPSLRGKLSRVRLGLISEGINTWPLYIARALHMFEREGIEVEVTLTGSSVEQQAQLIAGRFDVGFQQADHVVRAVEHGCDLFIFMALGHAPDLTLVAASGVNTIEDLRGHAVGVDGARTGYALLLRRLLRAHGLNDTEVTFREIGGSHERYGAIRRGDVAACMLNAPFDANLVAEGFVALARMNEAFPGYPGPVMAARRSWVAAHERELMAFIRAYDAAYAWLEDRSNASEAQTLLPQRLAVAPKAASAALERFASRARPRISSEGLQQVIDTYWDAERLAKAKRAPATYMDLAYMQRALGAAE